MVVVVVTVVVVATAVRQRRRQRGRLVVHVPRRRVPIGIMFNTGRRTYGAIVSD